MIYERKRFTNLYFDKKKNSVFTRGLYDDEKDAIEKVLSEENFIYQDTIPCTIQWEFKGEIKKDKQTKEEIKDG